ncbi:hypothetical protein ACRS7P_25440 [Pseudomonas aeruginosa]|uniref:hypothetical protein n=1 Tax=Pseudomonas aeruginosa TaxID=287 RepID=UPI00330A0C5B|nr:hypothetical protein [Klebsiella pneumoniae]
MAANGQAGSEGLFGRLRKWFSGQSDVAPAPVGVEDTSFDGNLKRFLGRTGGGSLNPSEPIEDVSFDGNLAGFLARTGGSSMVASSGSPQVEDVSFDSNLQAFLDRTPGPGRQKQEPAFEAMLGAPQILGGKGGYQLSPSVTLFHQSAPCQAISGPATPVPVEPLPSYDDTLGDALGPSR